MRLRLLDSGAMPAALNMGLDEAVLSAVSAGRSPPTLRFYRWEPRAVSVGYFQGMTEEIDVEACYGAGIDTVRRVTGGGAVFHDAEITYSIVVPEGHPLAPADILESYRRICAGLVEGLRGLGVDAAFAPINDIVAYDSARGESRGGNPDGGKKVSGNAQTRKQGCLLQHGTVLLDVDVETMFSLLKVPKEKLKDKMIEDAKARVTGLRSLLGRDLGYAEAAKALEAGFSAAWGRAYGIELEPGSSSPEELAEGAAFAREKYSTSAWNFRR